MSTKRYPVKNYLLGILTVSVGILLITTQFAAPSKASSADAAKPAPGEQVATLAAGCFWSMQAMYEQLKGVVHVEPGYAGGTLAHPSYEDVETGTTGHAETVNIIFDPKVISYADLVRVLLTAKDPTTLDRQGPDEGTQYRSVIFYHDAEQKKVAEQEIAKATSSHLWPDPIVTTVTPYTNFYPAEAYHFDYYKLQPMQPYCAFVIAPEIAKFRDEFKDKLKS